MGLSHFPMFLFRSAVARDESSAPSMTAPINPVFFRLLVNDRSTGSASSAESGLQREGSEP